MEEKSANLAAPQYGVDTNWYLDSGATDHITGDLKKLIVRDRYNGNEQIHTTSGSGMDIKHIGRSAIHTLDRDLYLNNILHVPEANKSLISASRLAINNNSFVEIHPYSFYVKDRGTRKVLLQGKGRRGLYPLKHIGGNVTKHVLSATKPSSDLWHRRLGHPSSIVVRKIISENKLPCVSNDENKFVCDACQKGKSHQLPYPQSMSGSKFSLALIFSDVWGPAVETVGRKKYYVSFIDDFSKFTWIYLIKHKSEVFQKFHDFQKLVER